MQSTSLVWLHPALLTGHFLSRAVKYFLFLSTIRLVLVVMTSHLLFTTNFFSPLTELPQEPVLSPIISSTAHGPICAADHQNVPYFKLICAADHQKVPYFKLIWFAISYTRPSWVQTFVPVFHSVDRNPKISTKNVAAPATTSLPSQPPATTLLPFYSQASDRAGHSAYLHSVRLTTIGHKFRLKLSIYKGSPESEQLEI